MKGLSYLLVELRNLVLRTILKAGHFGSFLLFVG